MKIFIVLALASLASAKTLLGKDRCVWGPSYWCNDIKTATECGAVKHCIGTVWKNQHLKTVKDDIPMKAKSRACDMCKDAVKRMRQFLLNKSTQKQIVEFMQQACRLIPDSSMQKRCTEVISDYAQEFFELIVSELDANRVCSAIRLCSTSFQSQVVHSHSKIPKVYPVGDSTTCTLCEDVVTELEKYVSSASTVDEFKKMVEKDLCSRLGSGADVCNTVVEVFGQEILELVKDYVNPKKVCSYFGVCSVGNLSELSLRKLQRQKFKFAKKANSEGCDMCRSALQKVQNMLKSENTQEVIKTAIDSYLCDKLPSFSLECKMAVQEMLPEIMNTLSSDLDPKKVCETFGLCNSTVSQRKTVAATIREAMPVVQMKKISEEMKPLVMAKLRKPVQNNGEVCTVCQMVVTQINELLGKNSTQKEIKDLIDNNICKNLGGLADTCDAVVAQYLPQIMKMLEGELDPETLCKQLRLCNSTSLKFQSHRSLPQKAKKNVKNTIECVICEYVMTYLDKVLTENATEEEIKDAVENICKVLPATVSTECKNFIDQYLSAIVDLLVKQVSPKEICSDLKICSTKFNIHHTVPKAGLSGDYGCLICKEVAEYAQEALKEQAVETLLESIFDKFCDTLPPSDRSQCDQIVKHYAPSLMNILQQEMDPNKICQELKLCTSKSPSNHESAVVMGRVHIWKHTYYKCEAGPSYWCSSKQNAALCKATNHCKKYVWKQ